MKKLLSFVLAAGLLFAISTQIKAQAQTEKRSKKAVAADVAGKVAKETGKAAVRVTVITAKAAAKHVVVPVAKVAWDPLLKRAAPRLLRETAKLAGKGIKNGFKLIFKRDGSRSSTPAGT